MERIIPVSNKKSVALLFASLLFVLCGVWMTGSSPASSGGLLNDPAVRKTTGIGAVLFFGACGLFIASRLFGKRKSFLRIDLDGVYDHVAALNAGLVKWRDMESVALVSNAGQKFLVIALRHPEVYLHRAGDSFRRKAIEYNLRRFGSPVAIPVSMLGTDPQELKNFIDEALEQYNHRLVRSHAYPVLPVMA